MKKIYSFIALLLMCCVGTTQAQRLWKVGEKVKMSTFKPGEDTYYVIQEGDNSIRNANGAIENGPYSQGRYLTSGQGLKTPGYAQDVVTHECVYQFIQTGRNSLGLNVYVLKNVATGMYLSEIQERYQPSIDEAFHFCLNPGVPKPEEGIDLMGWEMYYNAVSNTRSVMAQQNGAWVFCDPYRMWYMCFFGAPAFDSYTDTNNWYIKFATEKVLAPVEKLAITFDKYFSEGLDEYKYPVGQQPGCYPQEFLDRLKAVYHQAEDLLQQTEPDSAACLQTIAEIEAIMEEAKTAQIPITPGCYVIQNVHADHRGFLTVTDNGEHAHGDPALAGNDFYPTWKPEMKTKWTAEDAKYIWVLEPTSTKDQYVFKNFGTEKYLESGGNFRMLDQPTGPFVMNRYELKEFTVKTVDGLMHITNINDNKVIIYNYPKDRGSRFQFLPVPTHVTDSLSNMMGQFLLNQELEDLMEQYELDSLTRHYTNGFINSDRYHLPTDAGLATHFMKVNSYASNDGSKAAAFDGDLNTYFHTAWSARDVEAQGTMGGHWVQLDLGHAVKELVVKFSKRKNVTDGHISAYRITAPDRDDPNQPFWEKVIAKSADSIAYDVTENNNCHIARYTFNEPVRYVRFEPTSTRGLHPEKNDKMTAGTGPFWHCAELRFYDGEETMVNPALRAIHPDSLRKVVAQAKVELQNQMATQQTIDALRETSAKYWNGVDEMMLLLENLETAQRVVDLANIGTAPGQFPIAAKEVFQQEIDTIKAEVDSGYVEVDRITEFKERLQVAQDLFKAQLILPQDSMVYRLVCVQPSDYKLEENRLPFPEWGACIASVNADSTSTPVWRYNVEQGVTERFNTLWQVERAGDRLALRNLANGFYLNNPFDGLTEEEQQEVYGGWTGYSKTPKYFKLEPSHRTESAFLIMLNDRESLNLGLNGKVVYYDQRDDNRGIFCFEPYNKYNEISESYYYDVVPGQLQVITLPFDIKKIYTRGTRLIPDGLGMKVVGRKDKMVIIDNFADEDTIKAGMPVIIDTRLAKPNDPEDQDEDCVEAVMLTNDIHKLSKLSYNYDPVNLNELISTSVPKEVPMNSGYLVDRKIRATKEGQVIPAGSGYFGSFMDIPEVDPSFYIRYFIEVEDALTGIEQAKVVKNVPTDVYTITGVKVREKVMRADATKGLPKGVYIVGGEKVLKR